MTKQKKDDSFGPDKKALTRDVTLRFMMISGEIMMIHRHAGTALKTRTAFCASLGLPASQFNAYENGQNVTVENLAKICQLHKVSGTWLLTGEGPRYHFAEMEIRVQRAEERLSEVETKLGLNALPKKK